MRQKSTKIPRDRPANEDIDVTPEMERAGLEALFSFDVAIDDTDEVVREVYRVMEAVRRQARPEFHPPVQRST
jgi:hypothetical protein